jgi:hypothetical protein
MKTLATSRRGPAVAAQRILEADGERSVSHRERQADSAASASASQQRLGEVTQG